MPKQAGIRFRRNVFHSGYCDGVHGDELEAFAKLVAAKEREACESIEYDLAKSPAMFATMSEYKAYKDGVQDYRTRIIARGEA